MKADRAVTRVQVQPAPGGPGASPARPSTAVLWTVSLWRLTLAGSAWTGFVLGMTRGDRWAWPNLFFWSQFSTLLVALTATGSLLAPLLSGGRLERPAGYLRGAATTYAAVTLVVFPVLLSGTYRDLDGQLMHLVVPILAIVDWLLMGRNQSGVRWFGPLLWLIVPLCYLPVYVLRSSATRPLYGFLDPRAGDFATWVAILLSVSLATGCLLWAAAQMRARLLASSGRSRW